MTLIFWTLATVCLVQASLAARYTVTRRDAPVYLVLAVSCAIVAIGWRHVAAVG